MTRTMSTTQAADYFGVTLKTIRRWIKANKVNAEMIDGRWHIHVEGHHVPDNDADDRDIRGDNVQSHNPDSSGDNVHHLKTQLERADSEIRHLRDQLQEKDNQLSRRDEQIDALTQALDHAQQLAAMSQKQTQALTERLEALEDLRHRPWWKRFFGR